MRLSTFCGLRRDTEQYYTAKNLFLFEIPKEFFLTQQIIDFSQAALNMNISANLQLYSKNTSAWETVAQRKMFDEKIRGHDLMWHPFKHSKIKSKMLDKLATNISDFMSIVTTVVVIVSCCWNVKVEGMYKKHFKKCSYIYVHKE